MVFVHLTLIPSTAAYSTCASMRVTMSRHNLSNPPPPYYCLPNQTLHFLKFFLFRLICSVLCNSLLNKHLAGARHFHTLRHEPPHGVSGYTIYHSALLLTGN
jgi:hypothetical protein